MQANTGQRWRPKTEQLGTYYFVYAGRRYALPKVAGFVQTALELAEPPFSPAAARNKQLILARASETFR